MSLSLRTYATIWILGAALSGGLSVFTWMQSNAQWHAHLDRAYNAGIAIHDYMKGHDVLPDTFKTSTLPGNLSRMADANLWRKLPEISSSDYISRFVFDDTTKTDALYETWRLAIVSDALSYGKETVALNEAVPNAQKLGQLVRLMANYCSVNSLYIKYANNLWVRFDGEGVWGCAGRPIDWRLGAIALMIASILSLFAFSAHITGHFSAFTHILSQRHHSRGVSPYKKTGPTEVALLADALNSHIEQERASLEKRAMFLSGVSHDLGTPATRLLLRSEFITDPNLRHKIEADISQMTDMIESVLAYTQTEMNEEEARRLSLSSLVQAIVDDYIDIDKPVQLLSPDSAQQRVHDIFFHKKTTASQETRGDDEKFVPMVIYGQPLSLQRAITNLIDNALKYGRRASVSLRANERFAHIIIDDDGLDLSAERLAELTQPFKRGQNASNTKGKGIGLAITATIAEQHGGDLTFEQTSGGLRAILTIARA